MAEEKNADMLLRSREEYPDDAVLKRALKGSFPAFTAFIKTIGEPDYQLVAEWRYYLDGKAWLCKVQKKAKTVLWLSVWDGFFRTTFYFTAKSGAGIKDLEIDAKVIKDFQGNKSIGKLRPLTLIITRREQLHDLFSVIRYKMKIRVGPRQLK